MTRNIFSEAQAMVPDTLSQRCISTYQKQENEYPASHLMHTISQFNHNHLKYLFKHKQWIRWMKKIEKSFKSLRELPLCFCEFPNSANAPSSWHHQLLGKAEWIHQLLLNHLSLKPHWWRAFFLTRQSLLWTASYLDTPLTWSGWWSL